MYKLIIILILSFSAYAGDSGDEIIKKNLGKLNNFTADTISQFFNGPGTTEVEVRGIENKKPEFSILLVRPFVVSEDHSFFRKCN